MAKISFCGRVGHDVEEVARSTGDMCSLKQRMAQTMMPYSNGMSSPLFTAGERLCSFLARSRPRQTARTICSMREVLAAVELGREADLDVAHALGEVVLRQLVGRRARGSPAVCSTAQV